MRVHAASVMCIFSHFIMSSPSPIAFFYDAWEQVELNTKGTHHLADFLPVLATIL